MRTKQGILLGKGAWAESSRVREPRRTALPHGSQSHQVYVDGISFQVVFSQPSWLRVLPGGAHLVQPRWMPAKRILGGGRTCGVSFWPFPNFSSWWWLISSLFLTRISSPKTTHASGYYGAWTGWAVSVSVLPLIAWLCTIYFLSQVRPHYSSCSKRHIRSASSSLPSCIMNIAVPSRFLFSPFVIDFRITYNLLNMAWKTPGLAPNYSPGSFSVVLTVSHPQITFQLLASP